MARQAAIDALFSHLCMHGCDLAMLRPVVDAASGDCAVRAAKKVDGLGVTLATSTAILEGLRAEGVGDEVGGLSEEENFIVAMCQGLADPASANFAYLSSLGQAPNPANWPADVLEECALVNSPVYQEVLEVQRTMNALAARACLHGKVSSSQLLWAQGHLYSRRFYKNNLGEGNGVLLPCFDLLNHSIAPNCRLVWSDPSGSVRLESTRAIEKDEELSISYGLKSNEEFLAGFGFALANNPCDCVTLWLTRQEENEVVRHGPFLLKLADNEIIVPDELWSCLNSAIAWASDDDDDDEDDKAHETRQAGEVFPESVQMLQDNLKFRLARLEPSKLQDAKVLKSERGSCQMRYSAIYRKGQRDLLEKALKMTEDMLDEENRTME